jgi:hypothetical protein
MEPQFVDPFFRKSGAEESLISFALVIIVRRQSQIRA